MRIFIPVAAFGLALVLGFGVSSFRTAGVTEMLHLSAGCEVLRIAKDKGILDAAARARLIEDVANASGLDASTRDVARQLKSAKNC